MDDKLVDPPLERAVLAAIVKLGGEAYYDVNDKISTTTFSVDHNQVLFKAFTKIFEDDTNAIIDIPLTLKYVSEIGCGDFFTDPKERAYLEKLFIFPVEPANLLKFAVSLRKKEIARLLRDAHLNTVEKLENISGAETVDEIIGMSEGGVLDCTANLQGVEDKPKSLGSGSDDYLANIEANPDTMPGISTGMPIYDRLIGGGLQPKTTHLLAARLKSGKSMIALNIGLFTSNPDDQNVAVLLLDTEMDETQHINRSLANLSKREVTIDDIKYGRYVKNNFKRGKVRAANEELKRRRFDHVSIKGKSIQELLPMMRRWVLQNKIVQEDGSLSKCLIIYDYIKVNSMTDFSKNLNETILLGLITTALHDFGSKYDVPILTFAQLNRAGIKESGTDTIFGSDRIAMYCDSISLYHPKLNEDVEEVKDGQDPIDVTTGTHKLYVKAAREGPGTKDGDYINIFFEGKYALIREGLLQSTVIASRKADKNPDGNEKF